MRFHVIRSLIAAAGLACLFASSGAYAFNYYFSAAGCTPGLDGSSTQLIEGPFANDRGQHLGRSVWHPTFGWSNFNLEWGMVVYCPIPYDVLLRNLNFHHISVDVMKGAATSSSFVVSLMSWNGNSTGGRTWRTRTTGAIPVGFNNIVLKTSGDTPTIPEANLAGDFFYVKVLIPKYTGAAGNPSRFRGLVFASE
jgi:hypothetical protein